jgi:hypothetical protein
MRTIAFKVEKWAKSSMKVDRLFYAGNNLKKARELFDEAVKRRPRIRLTGGPLAFIVFYGPHV